MCAKWDGSSSVSTGPEVINSSNGKEKRYIKNPLLLEAWKKHIEVDWVIPIKIMTGIKEGKMYTQVLLGVKCVLGNNRT